MDLKLFRSFLAVADTLSFSRAAERLHVSQPALSKQIQMLEEELGASLFDRNRRSVSLTAVGKDILGDAEKLLTEIDELKYRVSILSKGNTGTLRIGFVVSATPEVIPKMTLAFRKIFPDGSLQLKNIPTVQQVDELRSGRIDLGVIRLPLHEQDIEVFTLASEPFVLVLPKQHPLRHNETVTVRDFKQEAFIAYAERLAPGFFQHWTSICRKAGFTPRIIQEVAEMETALALVSAGIGVAIVPQGVAMKYRRAVSVVPLRGEKLRSEIGLALLKVNASPLAHRLAKGIGHPGSRKSTP